MRYLITIEYFGKNYSGWQSQKNAIGVADVLNEKLSELFKQKINIDGSGRTDAGVHAIGQMAHFDAAPVIPPSRLAMAINTRLPYDIRVKKAVEVPADFHARFDAKQKTYVYKMYVSRMLSPVRLDTHAQVIPPIDFAKMVEASKDLVGRHDFVAFSSAARTVDTTVRTVVDADLTMDGDEIIFSITGDGFLYNMVRIIVGTLVFIGKGKIPVTAIRDMLQSGDRTLGGKTYAPHGLYLKEVKY